MQKSSATTKQKRGGRTSRDSVDNFFVQHDKVVLVNQFKGKVEKMFEIQLAFEDPVDGGQWLNLQGDQGDRRNAKNYINALIHPEETQQVKFPDDTCKEFTQLEKLELIEKQTSAVIKPLKNIAEFEIGGTDLAVTLALSMMEEIAGNLQQKTVSDEGAAIDKTYLSPSSASERLYTSLQRALSDHSDGACSINEYVKAPESVKRVLVECIEDDDDVEDDLLFADGETTRNNIVDITDEMEVDGVSSQTKMAEEPSVADKITDKLNVTAISQKKCPPVFSKQQEYLKTLGTTIGYKHCEILEALNFVHDKTHPADFIDILQSVKKKGEAIKSDSDDDVVILEIATIDLVDGESVETIVDHTKSRKTIDKSTKSMNKSKHSSPMLSPYKRDLPDSYKERLLRDMLQEDQSSSVEELKQRNAERQKMLKQTFQHQQGDLSVTGCDNKHETQASSQMDVDKSVKPKTKSAPGKKQKSESKASNSSRRTTQSQQNDCEARYQNDMEQTCVMRPWVPEDQDCIMTKQTISNTDKNEWTTPKRRRPQVSSTITSEGVYKQQAAHSPSRSQPAHSPSRSQPDLRRNQATGQGPRGHGPGRGKPVQVVSPTNIAVEKRPLPPLPLETDPDELKYIVIDGTNVALSHGKGIGNFSSKRIFNCVDFFKKRGHKNITVFLPRWRKKGDDAILQQLQDEGILTLTPSRKIDGRYIASYDDRFILRLAEEENGVIVSNDNFRDIMDERANWKRLVHNSLLMFCFVGDHFMPPDDPLGRDGPTLDEFLRKSKEYQTDDRPEDFQHQDLPLHSNQPDPNFHKDVAGSHPAQQFHTDFPVQSQGQGHRWPSHSQGHNVTDSQNTGFHKYQHQNQGGRWNNKRQGHTKYQEKQLELRTDNDSQELYKELRVIFPEEYQEDTLRNVLSNHPCETDLTKLTNYCMSVLFP